MGLRRRVGTTTLGMILATTGIVALAPPAVAGGGAAMVSGNSVIFTGTAGVDTLVSGSNIALWCGTAPHCIFFYAPNGNVTAQAGCATHTATVITCTTPAPAEVTINLGTGDDVFTADPNQTVPGAYQHVTVDGGDGNDTINGGGAPETLIGGNGNDIIYADQGANAATVGPDTLIGGAGSDVLYYNKSAGQGSGVRASFNGVADDGTSLPGDVDNIGSDFESVVGGNGNDVLTGDDRPTSFYGLDGNDLIDGRGGNDLIVGQGGDDHLTGGPGADKIWGDSNTIPTVTGNDTIVANDGESDQVTCGPGTDSVTADSIDTIADPCESITTPGGGTPLAAEVAVTKTRLNANKRRKKAPLALQCTGGLPCAGTVVVRTTKGKSRRIAGNKTVALGTFTVDANGTRSVQLKLTRAARKILKRTKRADVRARLTLTNERVTTFTTLKLTR